MFRKADLNDKKIFMEMIDGFYHSSAVLHPVDLSHAEITFKAAIDNSPYIDIFMIEDEGKIKGYILTSITWSNEAGGITVWLEELYILEEFRGQGLGTKAIKFLEEYYPDASRIRLEIEPDNKAAEKLYKRLGFDFLDYRQMIIDFGVKL